MHSVPYSFSRRLLGAVVVLGLSLTISGCGAKGTITGKVTMNGQPLHFGTVTFMTESGLTFQSPINDDGSYSLKDVPTGTVKISVFEPAPVTQASRSGPPGRARMGPPPDAKLTPGAPTSFDLEANKEKYVKIPDNVNDPDRSGLTYTVKGGAQEFNIDLK